MLCTAFEELDMHRFRSSATPIRIIPVIKRLKFRTNSIYCKIFIYIHKNLFAPQAQDLLEKLAEILLYNFHREHILLKLKTKKLLRKFKSKNLTAGVLSPRFNTYIRIYYIPCFSNHFYIITFLKLSGGPILITVIVSRGFIHKTYL